MKIKEIMEGIEHQWMQGPEVNIQGISYDSRKTGQGFLFVCIPGFKTDGHDYIQNAIEKGAIAVLAQHKVEVPDGISLLITQDTRKALPVLSANFYGHPSQKLKVVGVTGTNGKTSTTHLVQAILEKWGKKTGIMGTLYARIDEEEKNFGHTTPESVDIQSFIHEVVNHAGEYMVMEVSSHALDLGRVDGVHFHSAVFTNLTQDHLDYHETMDAYRACKVKLFQQLSLTNGSGIINIDDSSFKAFVDACPASYVTYGMNEEADIRAVDVKTGLRGSQFTVWYKGHSFPIKTRLIGLFSVYNTLAAVAFALQEGIEPAIIQEALEEVYGVPGRFEQVDCGQDFTVVVDYAHTPDGLENILKTGRKLAEKRLITVFGCGGDRDRTKRPIMGRIAAQYSDFCIVTSDNPRTEGPEAIIDEIIPGLHEVEGSRYARVVDRREAIHHAITMARPGDLVIIAGKGHETYQLVKDQVLPFDDRKVAAEFLKGMTKA